jgi:hypothetical protein
MKRDKLAGVLMIILCAWVLAIAGCRSDSDDAAAAPAALSTYSEDVAALTPQAPADAESLPGAEVNASIAEWAGWDPALEFTVFYKLLAVDSAEGLFAPIANADMFIEMINELQEYWDEDGTYEDIPLGIADGTATVTVDSSVTSVNIPFYGGTQAVDRLITVEGEFEGDEFECQIAFRISGGEEAIVVWSKMVAVNDISLFYGRRAADGLMTIWGACFADKATVDTSDDFYGAFKWVGNPDEGWFAATQITNAADDSWILAGGEPDGDMAFLATRTDDAEGPVPFYLVCTMDNFTGGTPIADEDILNGDDTPPLQATQDVLKYIEEGNASCLGFLTEYPDAEAEILPLIEE